MTIEQMEDLLAEHEEEMENILEQIARLREDYDTLDGLCGTYRHWIASAEDEEDEEDGERW